MIHAAAGSPPDAGICRDPLNETRVTSPPKVTSQVGQLALESREMGPQNSHAEPTTLKLLRTVCGLGEVAPLLTCENARIQTLKRNSTTSPSAMT